MDRDEARNMIDQCRKGWTVMNKFTNDIIDNKIWITLGYSSFTDIWVAEGFNEVVLEVSTRKLAIEAMIKENTELSSRELAKKTGLGKSAAAKAKKRVNDLEISAQGWAPNLSPSVPESHDKSDTSNSPNSTIDPDKSGTALLSSNPSTLDEKFTEMQKRGAGFPAPEDTKIMSGEILENNSPIHGCPSCSCR